MLFAPSSKRLNNLLAHTNSVPRIARPKTMVTTPGPGSTSMAHPSSTIVTPITILTRRLACFSVVIAKWSFFLMCIRERVQGVSASVNLEKGRCSWIGALVKPHAPRGSTPSGTSRPRILESCSYSPSFFNFFINGSKRSIGTGNMVVEFFSAATSVSVWRNLSCNAIG